MLLFVVVVVVVVAVVVIFLLFRGSVHIDTATQHVILTLFFISIRPLASENVKLEHSKFFRNTNPLLIRDTYTYTYTLYVHIFLLTREWNSTLPLNVMINCRSLIKLKTQEGGHNSGIEKKLVIIMTLKEGKLQTNMFLLLIIVWTFFWLEKINI